MGFTLGLFGAGGAILTIPIMVYLFSVEPILATVYSLFIVGVTAFIGSVNYLKEGMINLKQSLYFAIPSVIIMILMRKFLIPSVPDNLNFLSFSFTKNTGILVLFSIVLLSSSISMIKGGVKAEINSQVMSNKDKLILIFSGVATGIIGGAVGAGGGFVIIPALVLLAKMPVKKAVGTSLIIIAINSLTGFISDLTGNYYFDWKLILIFLAIAIAGIITGGIFEKKISPGKLKVSFGYFILIMGIYIFLKETIFS